MKLKCEYCGNYFESDRKRKYCKDIECIRRRSVESSRKTYMKKKSEQGKIIRRTYINEQGKIIRKTYINEQGKNENNEIDGIKILEEHKKENNIVCEKEIVIDEGFGDLIQIAREIGTIRFSLIQQIQKINEKVKEHNNIEQDLLHRLENVEQLSESEAVEIAVSLKKNRNDRRIVKNSQYLISLLLNKAVPIKSPEKYVRKAIEIVKDRKYEPRCLNELFEEDMEEDNDQGK